MIVVTGGAGFIGSCLVAGLERAGAPKVVVVDRLDHDAKRLNIAKRGNIAAIVPPEAFEDFLGRDGRHVSAIYHLGAISSTTETDEALLERVNVALPLSLWRFCAARGVPYVYASSAATYGDGAHGFDDSFDGQSLRRLEPLNPYGRSKHRFDLEVLRLVAAGAPAPPSWAGLKFFNVYGPNEHHKGGQRSVAVTLFEGIRDTGRATLFRSHNPAYADGGQLRDFVHVDDCVAATLWLGGQPRVAGLFNIGTGRARSFLDLARAVFAAMDRPVAIDWVDTPAAIRDRYQYFTEARIERLRAAGYTRPFTPLEDGVARYVRGFLATGDPHL
ncbi:MAG: ADP-glyceromanno-heptose 6-epimerase [Rhodospirillales bacterium]|nr:ADP-glyceromanno-heptose 6-epimerase [Rhodospirillales bacterium]